MLESLGNPDDHQPLNPNHILETMPSLQEIRGLTPAIIKDDELQFIYEKHEKYGFDDPKHRIGFMHFINHFYRIRTDPRFLIAEAVACHRITGSKHKKRRMVELQEMVDEAKEFGCDSLAPEVLHFLEWYNRIRRRKTMPPLDHLGRDIAFRVGSKAWATPYAPQVFSCKTAAERYARDHFRLRYRRFLEDE